MDNTLTPPPDGPPAILRNWGFWAVATGAMALTLVFVQIFGPLFEPSPSIGDQIGEIAGDIKRSAWRTFLGLPKPEPEAATSSFWIVTAIAGPALGALAIVLSVISRVRREHWRLPAYGTGLGIAAIVFHFVWWITILVAGVMLLVSILENMDGIFSIWE